jgi:hypothetical protein
MPEYNVTCQICHQTMKALSSHIKTKHNLSVAEYKEQFGQDVDMGYTVRKTVGFLQRAADKSPSAAQAVKEIADAFDPMESILSGLSVTERVMYDTRFAVLYKQSQEDPMFESTVRSVALNEIFLLRMQNQLHTLTSNGKKPNAEITKPIIEAVEKIQKQILASLQSLNATKKDRDALNKSPETTASRLITAFALTQHGMNEYERARFQKDNAEAMARLLKNRNDLLKLLPSDVPEDDEIKLLTVEEYD